jgi:hypothetical protein
MAGRRLHYRWRRRERAGHDGGSPGDTDDSFRHDGPDHAAGDHRTAGDLDHGTVDHLARHDHHR